MGAARLRIASFPTVSADKSALNWTLGVPIEANASHIFDNLEALVDGIEPRASDDHNIPRFTWWNHKGTMEWASLDLKAPRRI